MNDPGAPGEPPLSQGPLTSQEPTDTQSCNHLICVGRKSFANVSESLSVFSTCPCWGALQLRCTWKPLGNLGEGDGEARPAAKPMRGVPFSSTEPIK